MSVPHTVTSRWRSRSSASQKRARRAPRTLILVSLALVASLLTIALQHVAIRTLPGRHVDEAAFTQLMSHEEPMTRLLLSLLGVAVPTATAVIGCAIVLTVIRRDWSGALQTVLVVAGSVASAQLLKAEIIDRPVLEDGLPSIANSFPSGHASVAASAAVALSIATARTKLAIPTALLGTLWASGIGIGTVVAGWHRPSDVIGSFLIVAGWLFAARTICELFSLQPSRRPSLASSGPPPAVWFVMLPAGFALLAALAFVPLASTPRTEDPALRMVATLCILAFAGVTLGAAAIRETARPIPRYRRDPSRNLAPPYQRSSRT